MGCAHRCTFCYVRALRAARGPPVRRPLRTRRSASSRTSPRCCARAGPSRRGSARGRARHRDRSRTSLRRTVTGSRARASSSSAASGTPLLDHHPRPADRSTTSTCSRRAREVRGRRVRLTPDARRAGLADDRGRHRRLRRAASELYASSPTPGSRSASAWRRSCRASRIGRSSSRPSSARPRERGAAASGRASSTCARESASTSSRRSPRDWPEQLEHYEALFATRAYLPTSVANTITAPCARGAALDRLSRAGATCSTAAPAALALALTGGASGAAP